MGQFGLMSGTMILNQTFDTKAEAEKWGEWNARGRSTYRVIHVDDAEQEKAMVRKARREDRHQPHCVCAKHQAGIWFCPEHGNVSA